MPALSEEGTVWAVSSGQYSDYGVCAVFSTKEAAETYAARHNALMGRASKYDEYFVEDFPLNPEAPPEGKLSWTVYVRQNGDIQEARQNTYCIPLPGIHVVPKCPRFPEAEGWQVHCFADDRAHAIKIAGERRQQALAEAAMLLPGEEKKT